MPIYQSPYPGIRHNHKQEVSAMNSNQAHIPPGMLERIIQDKQYKTACYEVLQRMTADRQNTEMIGRILEDERRHLNDFTRLYYNLFGGQPSLLSNVAPQIASFTEGIQYLFAGEIDTYNFYSNIFFTDPNTEVQDVFRRAVLDENMHSTQLNHVFINSSLSL